jgi:hypothetical protein
MRWEAGYANKQRAIRQAVRQGEFDPLEGVILHESTDDGRLEHAPNDSIASVRGEANAELTAS